MKDYIEVKPLEPEYGKLFKMPYSIENIKRDLNNFLIKHPDHFENELENDDFQVFAYLNENSYDYEKEQKLLFQILDKINNMEIDLSHKYVYTVGILRITLYNKEILNMNLEDILSIADVFNEISLSKLGLYDSLLGNTKKLNNILKDGTNYSQKRFIMFDAKDEIDYVFDEEPSNKNMIS